MSTDDRLWLSRSWTTRRRREGEAEDAYVFVDRAEFEAARDRGQFLEWAEVFGHLYGTPVPSPPPGRDLLLEIDVQGAAQVKHRCPEAVVILVAPPSRRHQEERLRRRGDGQSDILRRMAKADEEELAARGLADHVVVNDDLGLAIADVAGIVSAHRGSDCPA